MRAEPAVGALAIIVLAASVTVLPSGAEPALDPLRGLPIHEFFDASYRLILLRDPEAITAMGLAAELGVSSDRLTPVSREYVAETYDLYRGILSLLQMYDRSALDGPDRLSYDVYEWILDDRLRGEPGHGRRLEPAMPLDIQYASAGSGWAFYAPGSLDGRRPGVYYVNAEDGGRERRNRHRSAHVRRPEVDTITRHVYPSWVARWKKTLDAVLGEAGA